MLVPARAVSLTSAASALAGSSHTAGFRSLTIERSAATSPISVFPAARGRDHHDVPRCREHSRDGLRLERIEPVETASGTSEAPAGISFELGDHSSSPTLAASRFSISARSRPRLRRRCLGVEDEAGVLVALDLLVGEVHRVGHGDVVRKHFLLVDVADSDDGDARVPKFAKNRVVRRLGPAQDADIEAAATGGDRCVGQLPSLC